MLSGIRTTFFSTELLTPPVEEMRINKEHIRDLYIRLTTPGQGRPYENLDLQKSPCVLSSRRENGGESVCRIGDDRLVIQEYKPTITVGEFVGLVDSVLQNLDVPAFFMQRCRIQCVGQPVHCTPLELLSGRVANVDGEDKIKPFERPPFEFGVRFRFAPHDPQDVQPKADPDNPAEPQEQAVEKPAPSRRRKLKAPIYKGFMNLRIETYNEDEKLVWLEAASTYQNIFTNANRSEIGDNINETHKFMTEQAMRFLAQYDQNEEK
jgi:hypothetical protein